VEPLTAVTQRQSCIAPRIVGTEEAIAVACRAAERRRAHAMGQLGVLLPVVRASGIEAPSGIRPFCRIILIRYAYAFAQDRLQSC
jgi:hypothetical protein